eukprot:364707-Chlamydomonas_euryale.AAC.9
MAAPEGCASVLALTKHVRVCICGCLAKYQVTAGIHCHMLHCSSLLQPHVCCLCSEPCKAVEEELCDHCHDVPALAQRLRQLEQKHAVRSALSCGAVPGGAPTGRPAKQARWQQASSFRADGADTQGPACNPGYCASPELPATEACSAITHTRRAETLETCASKPHSRALQPASLLTNALKPRLGRRRQNTQVARSCTPEMLPDPATTPEAAGYDGESPSHGQGSTSAVRLPCTSTTGLIRDMEPVHDQQYACMATKADMGTTVAHPDSNCAGVMPPQPTSPPQSCFQGGMPIHSKPRAPGLRRVFCPPLARKQCQSS